jgi:hypothetical protein
LSAILASSALSFAIVRWAGVAYLVYLAVGALHSAPIRAARAPCWRCPPGGRTGRRSSHSTSIRRAAETPKSVPPPRLGGELIIEAAGSQHLLPGGVSRPVSTPGASHSHPREGVAPIELPMNAARSMPIAARNSVM